jgi:hypothetical protein
MKITKIIAAFMVAGLIGIAGCDTAVEVPEGGPAEGGDNMEQMQNEGEDMTDPGPADDAPADDAPADEAPADEAPADEAPADEAPADGGDEG